MENFYKLKVKQSKALEAGNEKEFYNYLCEQMVIPDKSEDHAILRSDIVLFQGYFSDVAAHRLKQQFNQIISIDDANKVIITNAMILVIKKSLYMKKEDIVPIMEKFMIEGNIYSTKTHILGLLFPIDLVKFNYIEIKKWKLL